MSSTNIEIHLETHQKSILSRTFLHHDDCPRHVIHGMTLHNFFFGITVHAKEI